MKNIFGMIRPNISMQNVISKFLKQFSLFSHFIFMEEKQNDTLVALWY